MSKKGSKKWNFGEEFEGFSGSNKFFEGEEEKYEEENTTSSRLDREKRSKPRVRSLPAPLQLERKLSQEAQKQTEETQKTKKWKQKESSAWQKPFLPSITPIESEFSALIPPDKALEVEREEKKKLMEQINEMTREIEKQSIEMKHLQKRLEEEQNTQEEKMRAMIKKEELDRKVIQKYQQEIQMKDEEIKTLKKDFETERERLQKEIDKLEMERRTLRMEKEDLRRKEDERSQQPYPRRYELSPSRTSEEFARHPRREVSSPSWRREETRYESPFRGRYTAEVPSRRTMEEFLPRTSSRAEETRKYKPPVRRAETISPLERKEEEVPRRKEEETPSLITGPSWADLEEEEEEAQSKLSSQPNLSQTPTTVSSTRPPSSFDSV